MPDKYSHMNELSAFGFLINDMGGGGDVGQSVPQSDAEDLSRGARFIPGDVTVARRRGEHVEFITACRLPTCWYWEMANGRRIYHWDRGVYDMLMKEHEGKCPECGNTHITGVTVTPQRS